MIPEAFLVSGGNTLRGELQPQGAKNEALQILCAVLMTEKEVTIHNVPNIVDVNMLIDLLRGLGCAVEDLGNGSWKFCAENVDLKFFEDADFRKKAQRIRGSVMLIGPLLARFGRAFLPKPGGDKIGRRRMDTHFNAFKALGADYFYDDEISSYSISCESLQGTNILMEEISVTGTANIVMAAALANGTTTIYNAACEPYLQQLSKMLNSMGAKIEGVGSNLLTITGVSSLHGCSHTVLPDMIEIGSFIGLAATTNSEITIKNCKIAELGNILHTFRRFGLTLDIQGDDIHVPQHDSYEIQSFIDGSIMTVYDSPWPGFTPDLMSILVVMATQAKGSVLLHQKMFESRLFFVDKLIDMGAKIILCDPHRATVIGMDRKNALRGIKMSSPDIRAGVSLLIAALSAEGQSTILNINQIDRGYQNIDGRLNAIGADIKRVPASNL